MALVVKFRSAKKFYTVHIDGGQPTISIQNLRSKLAGVIEDFPSNDDVNRGFDLVFYDAVSGEEFDEQNPNIWSGTTVFIKRLPRSHRTNTKDGGNKALEKFLTDFPPVPEWTPPPPPPPPPPQINVPRVAEPIPRIRGVDYHPELRCQICQYYLRDATLILCCYETFCKPCIDNELRKGRCPKCLSSNNIALRRPRRLIPNRLARSMVDRYVYSRNIPDEGSVTSMEELPKFTHDSKRKVHQSNEAITSSKRKAMETNDSGSSTSEEAGTSGQDGQNCYQGNCFNGWNHFTGGWSGAASGYPMHYSAGYYWAAPMGSYYMLYWIPFYGYWWGMDPSNFASTSTTPFPYQTYWGRTYSNHNYFSSYNIWRNAYMQTQAGPSQPTTAHPESSSTSEKHMDSKRRGKRPCR